MVRDVNVTVNRFTQAITQAGFGLPLILSTTGGVKAYAEYTDIADVALDYISTTNAYKMAAALFAQGLAKIAIVGIAFTQGVDPASDLTDALNLLRQTNDDWYFLLCEEQGDAEITELATNFINSVQKIYFADTETIGLAATLTSDRAVIMYKGDISDWPSAAWVGLGAKYDPGTITWKFKTLNGVAKVDLTETQISTLHTDGGNTYISALGINYTSEGQVSNNEFIDIIRSADFLDARITESVFGLLVRTKKVPYTQEGINQVAAAMNSVLLSAVNLGIIATNPAGKGEYTLTIPDINSISDNDKANRILTGISADVVLAGAIHSVNLTVNLVLSL